MGLKIENFTDDSAGNGLLVTSPVSVEGLDQIELKPPPPYLAEENHCAGDEPA